MSRMTSARMLASLKLLLLVSLSIMVKQPMYCCTQSEKQELEDKLSQKAADADALQSELQKYTADYQDLTQTLSSTRAELRSSVEQTLRTEEELGELRRTFEAQEAEAAAELESAKAQAGQMGRQLSEHVQRLDSLQVCHTCSWFSTQEGGVHARFHCSHGSVPCLEQQHVCRLQLSCDG